MLAAEDQMYELVFLEEVMEGLWYRDYLWDYGLRQMINLGLQDIVRTKGCA